MNVKFPNITSKWQNEFNSAFKGLNTNSIALHSAGSEERSNAFAPVHITSVDMRGCVSIAGNQFSCDFNRVRRYAVTHMLVVQQKQSVRPPARPPARPPDVQKANKAFDVTTLAVCKHQLAINFGARTGDPSILRFRDIPSEEIPYVSNIWNVVPKQN
jgi:hypothetical protein